jgi:molybdopterin/thiamine biosynthesis adenylyltransferase
MSALHQARVLVVGAGGLGCPATLQLARAGVGALTLCDPDRVEPSNLHRQLWHGPGDVGRPKVVSAAEKLARVFPRVAVTPLQLRVDAAQAPSLFADHALVVDATDGVEGKFVLADAAWLARVPLVHGGVLRMQGQAMLLSPGGPCLRCLFEGPPALDEVPTCAQAGVLGTLAGIVGAMQAGLALDYLGGQRAPAGEAELRVFDGAAFRGRKVRVRRRADCGFCGLGTEARA